MKTIQDKDGNVIEVADNTPCHAGKNGALPIMLDSVVDAVIFTEMADRDIKAAAEKVVYEAGTVKREALAEIARLESEITPRRTREALISAGGRDWLKDQDALITIERNKL